MSPYAARVARYEAIAAIMAEQGAWGSHGRLTALVWDFFDHTSQSINPTQEAAVMRACAELDRRTPTNA